MSQNTSKYDENLINGSMYSKCEHEDKLPQLDLCSKKWICLVDRLQALAHKKGVVWLVH